MAVVSCVRCVRLVALLVAAVAYCSSVEIVGRSILNNGYEDAFDMSKCPKTTGLGCKPFPTPVHGSVLIGATDTGHVKLTYSCSGSMHIVGSSELVCHPDADSQNRGGVWRKTGNESSSIVENAPVCAVCPSSQFQGARTGSCYFLTKSRLSSSFRFEYVTAGTAHKKCLGLNSSLVAIETAAEQEYISEFMVTKRHDDETVRDVLIGLTDINGQLDYRWQQNLATKINYVNWDKEHPKQGLRAAFLGQTKSLWNSVNASYFFQDFLCEQKAIVQCATPQDISNGNIRVLSHYGSPQRVKYECDPGYKMSNALSEYTCKDSGLWQDDAGGTTLPSCQPVLCPTPKHIDHPGNVMRVDVGGSFPYKTVLEYRCADGYHLAHPAHEEARDNGYIYAATTCLASGSWSHNVVKCEPCSCNTAYTTAQVCDWRTGRCLCDEAGNGDGSDCTSCADGYFRPGDDVGVPCQECQCGVAAMAGNKCDKKTGKCFCYPGCHGTCAISECNLHCPRMEHETTEHGEFFWNRTGVTATASIKCPAGVIDDCKNSTCLGLATRHCSIVDGHAQWDTANLDDCRYADNATEAIRSLTARNVTTDSAAEIVVKLSVATKEKAVISVPDIQLSTELLEKIVSVQSPDQSVGEGLLDTVAAIASADSSVLGDQRVGNDTNQLLRVVEDYATSTPFESGKSSRTLNVSGIEMVVDSLDPQATGDRFDRSLSTEDVSLPRAWFDSSDSSIANSGPKRVQITRFKDDALFVRSNTSNFSIPSSVLSISSPSELAFSTNGSGQHVEVIQMRFRPNLTAHPRAASPKCVYWDFATSDWDGKGCELVEECSAESEEGCAQREFVCSCSHLTHFAILMDLNPTETSVHTTVLEWITYIGVSLSLVGLLLTFVILGCYPKLRRQQQMKLLMQLSFAWTGALVSFLIGGQLAPFPKACAAFAVFIHYFLLVVFMWTLVQAVFLYISLVKVYAEGTKALFKKAIIGCWSIPVLVVVVTVASTKAEAYMPRKDGAEICMLNIVNARAAFLGSYLIPICAILFTNCILFALVLRRIIKPRPGMKKRQLEDHKRDLKISISLAVLLGLTWITGVGIVGETRIAFSYIFTFLNAFLGFFIFLLHLALRHEVVEEVSRTVSTKRTTFTSTRSSSSKGSRVFTSDANSVSGGWQPIKTIINATSALRHTSTTSDFSDDVSKSESDVTTTASPEKTSPSEQTQKHPMLGQLPKVESVEDSVMNSSDDTPPSPDNDASGDNVPQSTSTSQEESV